ncbi:hypothetical protein HYV80_04620 [Candidatus Woesearchaeota archaeon]|nr:hypothetical protein [Candidatus Woesearchaeota archaeon]
MNAEKMLNIVKKSKLSELKRQLSVYQAFMVSFLVVLIITFFDFLRAILSGETWVIYPFFIIVLVLLAYTCGRYFSNTTLLVEFKEKGVHKWNKKRALEYINEEKEEI